MPSFSTPRERERERERERKREREREKRVKLEGRKVSMCFFFVSGASTADRLEQHFERWAQGRKTRGKSSLKRSAAAAAKKKRKKERSRLFICYFVQ